MFSTLARAVSRVCRQNTPLSTSSRQLQIALGSRPYSTPATPTPPPTSSSLLPPHPAAPQRDPSWNTVFESLPNTTSRPGSLQTPHEIWAMSHADVTKKVVTPANAYSGRTVYVGREGFGEAYRRLDIILSRNKVRATVRMQERHEKKGVKRRRLSSERWRKQFANEVRKKVQLVKEIRNRGA